MSAGLALLLEHDLCNLGLHGTLDEVGPEAQPMKRLTCRPLDPQDTQQ